MDTLNPPFLGEIQRPHFCEKAINIGELCSSFSKEVDKVLPYQGTEWVTLQDSMDMPTAAIKEVSQICSVDHLTCEGEPSPDETASPAQLDTAVESRCSFPNISADLTGGWGDAIDERAAAKLKSLRFQRRKTSSLAGNADRTRRVYSNLRYRFEVRLESDAVQQALGKRRTFMKSLSTLEAMVYVRLYRAPKKFQDPSRQNVGSHHVFHLTQEILCLGTNLLTELRDEIRCPNDRLVTTDCSLAPATAHPFTAKKQYRSGFFCIGGVFLVDDRDPSSIDYSEPIREWAAERGIKNLKHSSMKGVRLQDLSVRLGYPYIYVHQGRCQHLVVFSDVRLFRVGFDVSTVSYPRTVAVRPERAPFCQLCERVNARWLTMEHELTPTNPTLFCDDCFHQFNYRPRRGKCRTAVCRFEAYPLHTIRRTNCGAPRLETDMETAQDDQDSELLRVLRSPQ